MLQVVRSTSSAHIAVDRTKHYLHYKHFSTAETDVTGQELSIHVGFKQHYMCIIQYHVTPPKNQKS